MRRRNWIGLLALFITTLGCRSQQLANDQDHIRTAVLDLHTNQIMDNLIRIRKGLPIIQLDYVHMTGTITDTATGGVSGANTNAGVTSVAFPKAVPTSFANMNRSITNLFGFTTGATQVSQLTINAEPVVNAPEVYSAYLLFLKDSSHLVESADPPSPDEALIVRCCERGCCDAGCQPRKRHEKVYYWVPCEYKLDFMKLALNTVALRGQPTPYSPDFEVAIKGFPKEHIKQDTKNPDAYNMVMIIDKKIPKDSGFMIATIKGALFDKRDYFQIRPVPPEIEKALAVTEKPNPEADQPQLGVKTDVPKTDRFLLSFDLKTLSDPKGEKITLDDILKELTSKDKKVLIHLEHFAPTGSPTDRLLEDIRYQLELNRLGQFQR